VINLLTCRKPTDNLHRLLQAQVNLLFSIFTRPPLDRRNVTLAQSHLTLPLPKATFAVNSSLKANRGLNNTFLDPAAMG